jgi:hypothetical protein
VTAVSRYPDNLDVLVVDTRGDLWNYWWDSTNPNSWGSQNITALTVGPVLAGSGQVAAISRYPNHLDVFSTDLNGIVQSYWWDAASGWNFVSGGVMSGVAPGAPVAVDDQGAGHLDVFTTTTQYGGSIVETWWDTAISGGWTGHQVVIPNSGQAFSPAGTLSVSSPLQAVSRFRGAIDVFGVGIDGSIWVQSWTDAHVANGPGGGLWASPHRVL